MVKLLINVNLYPVKDQTNTYIRTSHETRRIVGTSDSRSLSLIRVFDYYKQHDAYQKLIRVDIECDDLLAILQETNLFENMILTDSNNQVVVALNSYANSGKNGADKSRKNSGQRQAFIITRAFKFWSYVIRAL